MKNERWEDKDGNKKYRDKVRVSSFEFPPRSSNKKSSEQSPKKFGWSNDYESQHILKGTVPIGKTRSSGVYDKSDIVIPLSVLITWEDVYSILEKQNFKCKYTNIPLEPGFGKFGHELYEAYHPLAPSLDRINNDEGYHIDNISITLRFINLGLGGYKGNNLNILKTLGLVK